MERPTTLYCDLGHRYNEIEKTTVKKLVKTTYIDNRLKLGDFEKPDAHIPLRNAFLILIASLYDDGVALVCQKGEQDLSDRSPAFLNRMYETLVLLKETKKVRVLNPFEHMTKASMVAWYVHGGYDVDDLMKTWSCYTEPGGRTPCGQCSACFRRWVAMSCNDIKENYLTHPWMTPLAQDYITKMKAGEYDEERVSETFTAFRKVGVSID
jgi:7-cyano-7-deazaguanine synthase in queuosine biosynthesis